MRDVYYELNCLQYVLHVDGEPVCKPLDEVAIAYAVDEEHGLITRHKHGDPETVRAWVEKTKLALSQQGQFGKDMADEIRIYVGKPDVNMLNDALAGLERAMKDILFPPLVIDVEARVVAEEPTMKKKLIQVPPLEDFELDENSVANNQGLLGEITATAELGGREFAFKAQLQPLIPDSADDDTRAECSLTMKLTCDDVLIASVDSCEYEYHGNEPGQHLADEFHEGRDGNLLLTFEAQGKIKSVDFDLGDVLIEQSTEQLAQTVAAHNAKAKNQAPEIAQDEQACQAPSAPRATGFRRFARP